MDSKTKIEVRPGKMFLDFRRLLSGVFGAT